MKYLPPLAVDMCAKGALIPHVFTFALMQEISVITISEDETVEDVSFFSFNFQMMNCINNYDK